MKILYLHQYFTTPTMVGPTRSYEMARRLVQAGHDVHIITSWRGDTPHNDWWSEQIDGITIHWLPVPYFNAMGFWRRIWAFARFALGSAQKAVKIGGDLIFATSTPLTIAIPGVLAARRLKRPMVFEVRDLWPTLPIAIGALRNPVLIRAARWLERFAYRNASQIIALSPGMADGVVATGYDRRNLHIIPNGCDRELFSPDHERARRFRQQHPELGDGPIVLYAGTMGRINGVSYLAELAAHLLERLPSARFVIIGSGAENEKVRERAKKLGVLDKNFFLLGNRKKVELVDAFCAAQVSTSLFIDLPAMWHNSANKFFDGLASGTAIALNYGGWQAEIVQNNCCGILLGPDAAEGADKLAKALEDTELIQSMGENALRVAETQFDRDLLFDKFKQVLEQTKQR